MGKTITAIERQDTYKMNSFLNEDQAETMIREIIERYPNILSRLKEFEDREDNRNWTSQYRSDDADCYRLVITNYFSLYELNKVLLKYGIIEVELNPIDIPYTTKDLHMTFDALSEVVLDLGELGVTFDVQGLYK